VLGRTFLPAEEEQSGRNHVVVLSDRFWKRRFGAEPKIVGQDDLPGHESIHGGSVSCHRVLILHPRPLRVTGTLGAGHSDS